MASNEDSLGQDEKVIEILNPEQLAQENQALKAKVEAMEAQRAEIMNMLPVKEGCWDTLGEPSGKFDYLVRYGVPESARIRMEDIQPTGWDEEEEQYDQIAVINNGPKSEEGCWDTLGEPSGKFDYLVRYDVPESAQIRMEDIQPTGWDEEEEQYDQIVVIKNGSEAEESETGLVRRCPARGS